MSKLQIIKSELNLLYVVIQNFGFINGIIYNYYRLRWYRYHKDEDKYINIVYSYLRHLLSKKIQEYKEINNSEIEPESNKIWVCWWQGYDCMPNWCKLCFNVLKSNIPIGKELIMITKDNYSKYVSIPDYIFNRIEKNQLSLTQFSDILREALLYQQGGLWIDSSVFTLPNFCNSIDFSKDFWSIKLESVDNQWIGQVVSNCMWSGFIMYGKKNNLVTKFAFDCMCYYYQTHTKTIDYFIQNFIIRIGYDNIPQIKLIIDSYSVSNRELYTLYSLMNCPFSLSKWNSLTDDTYAFKVTQKKQYKEMTGNEKTFYGYILSNYNKCVNDR